MKSFYVTFERTVQVEVPNDAGEAKIKEAAVEKYNDPPSFEEMYLTDESIVSIVEVEGVDEIG